MTRVGDKIKGFAKGVGRAVKGLGRRIFGFLAKGGQTRGRGAGQVAKGVGEGGQEFFK